MEYSPTASRPSTLSEEFRTLIQATKTAWRGSLPPAESGDLASTLASGMHCLATLIEATVSYKLMAEQAMNDLDWGSGDVDVPVEVAKLTKAVILDVIEEFGKDS